MPRILKLAFWGVGAVAACAGLALAGFLLARFEVDPFHKLADRIESKLTTVSGGPDPLDLQMAQIETTFLRFKGTVYRIPDNDFINGGALTVWGEDLLILQRTGRLMRFDPLAERIVETSVTLPDNGVAAYIALSKTEPYTSYRHKPKQIRYNDITYVDSPERHGLAISYTFFDPDRICYGNRVDFLDIPRDTIAGTLNAAAADWTRLFETAPCLELNRNRAAIDGIMAGGRMAFQAPDTLIFGSGEFHLDGVHTYDAGIQDDNSDYGKVIGIDLTTGAARHIAKGLRNLQGVAVDAQNRIWTTEHAIRGGDELNLIIEGTNYGWPLETLGTLYSGQPWPSQGEAGRHSLHTPPVFAWLPSAAISSLAVINDFHPTWDGDLLATSLSSANFGHSLWHIRTIDDRAVFVERIFMGDRLRYVIQYKDKIAVWTDHNELVLLEIEPRRDPLADAVAAMQTTHPDVSEQVSELLRGCNECHSYEQGNNGGAPTLNGVFGRAIGVSGFQGYSGALSGKNGKWTPEDMAAYLDNPQTFAPGTSMPDPGLDPGPVLDALIWTLQQLNSTTDAHIRYN